MFIVQDFQFLDRGVSSLLDMPMMCNTSGKHAIKGAFLSSRLKNRKKRAAKADQVDFRFKEERHLCLFDQNRRNAVHVEINDV